MRKGSHSYFPIRGSVSFSSFVLLECLWIFFFSNDGKFSVRSDDEASVADEELKVAWYLRQQRSGRLMLSSIQWTVMGCCQNDSMSGCHSELGSVKAQPVAAAAAATRYIIIKHNSTGMVTCRKIKPILNYLVEQQSLRCTPSFFFFFKKWSLGQLQRVLHFFSFFFFFQRSEPILKLPETQQATKPVSQFSATALRFK